MYYYENLLDAVVTGPNVNIIRVYVLTVPSKKKKKRDGDDILWCVKDMDRVLMYAWHGHT